MNSELKIGSWKRKWIAGDGQREFPEIIKLEKRWKKKNRLKRLPRNVNAFRKSDNQEYEVGLQKRGMSK